MVSLGLTIKIKHMTHQELKEQLQEDLITILEGYVDESIIDAVCEAIIDNVNQFIEEN